ncbi:hypothetical protein AALO_G00154390 [Alosa alosa]|uniref:Uncharacterized protein n=1 Tax=Alosa alosa TaxID=278164 RepID=A0AAV6GI44_9TELE|nr:hypothetical protein AALO_G00154390 [Alosa alosa]
MRLLPGCISRILCARVRLSDCCEVSVPFHLHLGAFILKPTGTLSLLSPSPVTPPRNGLKPSPPAVSWAIFVPLCVRSGVCPLRCASTENSASSFRLPGNLLENELRGVHMHLLSHLCQCFCK